MRVKIHINRGGQSLGQFEPDEVRAGYREGKYLAADLAWRDGMAEWRPLGDVIDEIAPETGEGAPPPVAALKQDGPAWEQRDQLGFLKALLETIRAVLLEPTATFSTMRPFGGLWGPLAFAVIVGMVGAVANVFYQFAWTALGLVPQGDKEAAAAAAAIFGSGFVMIVIVVLMPLILAAAMFVSAGLVHLSLMIVGGARKPFESTFRVVCYAGGATAVLQLLPIVGAWVASIWALVAEIIGLAEVHGIGKGKATIAVLLPLIVCCGFVMLLVVAVIGLGLAGAAAATSGAVAPGPGTP